VAPEVGEAWGRVLDNESKINCEWMVVPSAISRSFFPLHNIRLSINKVLLSGRGIADVVNSQG
jgi:hypothetical protein